MRIPSQIANPISVDCISGNPGLAEHGPSLANVENR